MTCLAADRCIPKPCINPTLSTAVLGLGKVTVRNLPGTRLEPEYATRGLRCLQIQSEQLRSRAYFNRDLS